MKQIGIWIAISIMILVTGCSPQASSPTNPPLATNTPTIIPTITWTPTFTPTSTSTSKPEPTHDLTYAYEAIHRTPVEQITYSLDCASSSGVVKCHDTLLGMSFEYPAGLWQNVQPKLKWGSENGYDYRYFTSSSTDWPIAGGNSSIYAEGREWVIFDFGASGSADNEESICAYFSASACMEVKPNVYLAIMSSDGSECVNIPGAIAWGWWYPAAVVAVKIPGQSIINGFTFITPFLSAEDLAKPYGLLNISDNASTVCEKSNMEKYSQFFLDLIQGNWENVGAEARIKFEKMVHLAKSIEFDK